MKNDEDLVSDSSHDSLEGRIKHFHLIDKQLRSLQKERLRTSHALYFDFYQGCVPLNHKISSSLPRQL